MEQPDRISKDRASFYGCRPELYTRTGIRFIAEKKLKETVTLAIPGNIF